MNEIDGNVAAMRATCKHWKAGVASVASALTPLVSYLLNYGLLSMQSNNYERMLLTFYYYAFNYCPRVFLAVIQHFLTFQASTQQPGTMGML